MATVSLVATRGTTKSGWFVPSAAVGGCVGAAVGRALGRVASPGLGLADAPAHLAAHGLLMINGFLGALIGLEQAIALQKRWAYLAPVLTFVMMR